MTSLLSVADPIVFAPAADVEAAVAGQARSARRVLTHHALYGVTLR